jgi:hypothetical protein
VRLPCICPRGHVALHTAMIALPLQTWQGMADGKPRPPPLTNLSPRYLGKYSSASHGRRSGLSAADGASSATNSLHAGASTHRAAVHSMRARITTSTHSLANAVKAALRSERGGDGSAPSGHGANVYGPEPFNKWSMTAATGRYAYMAPEGRALFVAVASGGNTSVARPMLRRQASQT